MTDTSRSADAARPVLNATRARQGRYGRRIFWVLVASTLLAALGLLIAWTFKAPALIAADANVANTKAQAARQFSAPETPPAAQAP